MKKVTSRAEPKILQLKLWLEPALHGVITTNRAWPIQTISRFLPRRVGWPCPVRFALKRTPVSWGWATVFVFYMNFTGFLVIVETRKYVCSSIVAQRGLNRWRKY